MGAEIRGLARRRLVVLASSGAWSTGDELQLAVTDAPPDATVFALVERAAADGTLTLRMTDCSPSARARLDRA